MSENSANIKKLALSITEAADVLSISVRTIYNLIESGEIKTYKTGRRRLISLRELERYIYERETVGN